VSPMETFIVVVALLAAAGGGLILLSGLAGKRARLFEAFELRREQEERERAIRQRVTAGRKTADDSAERTADPGAGDAIPAVR